MAYVVMFALQGHLAGLDPGMTRYVRGPIWTVRRARAQQIGHTVEPDRRAVSVSAAVDCGHTVSRLDLGPEAAMSMPALLVGASGVSLLLLLPPASTLTRP